MSLSGWSNEEAEDDSRCRWTKTDGDGYRWQCVLDGGHEDVSDHLTALDVARLSREREQEQG